MCHSFRVSLVVGGVAAFGSLATACKAQSGAGAAVKSGDAARGAAPAPSIRCAERVVPTAFLEFAAARGVSAEVATELFRETLSSQSFADPVTGFGIAPEHIPMLVSAVAAARAGGKVFYVEADVHNLGGLNAALTYEEANVVFAHYAKILRENLEGVITGAGVRGGQLCAVRHGGDEFSFVVMAEDGLAKEALAAALDTTRTEISAYVARYALPSGGWFSARCLGEIAHPKHAIDPTGRYKGTGLHLGVVPVPPLDLPEDPIALRAELKKPVFDAIDVEIKASKSKPTGGGCAR
jgi:GGDEF domain-containing protein